MAVAYVLIILICVFLILIVLVQNSKGGGLASGFSGSQIMGVRKTADFLEKATWSLAGALILFCIIANLLIPRNTGTGEKSLLQNEIATPGDQNAVPKIPSAAPQQTEQAPAGAPVQQKK